MRAAVLVRTPRGAGGHARLPRRHAARAVAAEDEPREGARRDAPARPARGRVRDPRALDPARPPYVHGAQPRLSALSAPADVPRGEAAYRLNLQRVSEVALIAIAAVWGLTFVMVQDAIRELPTMAFLAYRFIPAALIVAVVFHRQLRRLSPEGWRAGL